MISLMIFVLLMSKQFGTVQADCSSNEKMFSLWLFLDCSQPFEIGSVNIIEKDFWFYDRVLYTHWPKPLNVLSGYSVQRITLTMAGDEIISRNFEFEIRINSTCNHFRTFDDGFVSFQAAPCNMIALGPHVLLHYQSLDKSSSGFATEEAY
ncbi:unnamed protein product [Auanema sp. JU1783]|nr:unnamed protein product [Auanema sp. JU1783]